MEHEPAAIVPSSGEAAPACDANLPARYFYRNADYPNSNSFEWHGDEYKLPPKEEEVAHLVELHNLHHGDVLNFGNYRDSFSCIVKMDPDSRKISLVSNPDDTHSGYLTIPSEILEQVSNFKEKYEDVIDDGSSVNFHLSRKDEHIKEMLQIGDDEDLDGWEFDLCYTYGSLDDFMAKPPSQDFEMFDLDKFSWTDIKNFFEARSGPVEEVQVSVKLEGEKVEEYKKKYSDDWSHATPELGTGWNKENGGGGGSANDCHWIWKFTGPSSSVSELKNNIDKFLEGFSYEYIQSGE